MEKPIPNKKEVLQLDESTFYIKVLKKLQITSKAFHSEDDIGLEEIHELENIKKVFQERGVLQVFEKFKQRIPEVLLKNQKIELLELNLARAMLMALEEKDLAQ